MVTDQEVTGHEYARIWSGLDGGWLMEGTTAEYGAEEQETMMQIGADGRCGDGG